MSIAPKMDSNEIIRQQLAEHESEMKRCWQEFARRLAIIRDERLYRAEFDTFEDYCKARWNVGRNFVNKQIQAAEIVNELVNNLGTMVPISNERTVREFKEVPKEDRPKVAEAAKEVAKGKGRDTINSRDVKEAKAKIYKVETKIEELPRDTDAEPVPTEPEPPTLVDVDDDEEWLKSLPIHASLQGVAKRRFEEAALTWKQFEAPFKLLAMQIRSAHKDTPSQFKSRFHTRQLSSFVIDAPQHWQVCRECGGTGQIPKIGQCGSCSSDGFQIGSYKR